MITKVDNNIEVPFTFGSREDVEVLVQKILAMLHRCYLLGKPYAAAHSQWVEDPGFPPIWLDTNGKRFGWWPMFPPWEQDFSCYSRAWRVERFLQLVNYSIFHVGKYNYFADMNDELSCSQHAMLTGGYAYQIWNVANDMCSRDFPNPLLGVSGYSPLTIPADV